MKALLKRFAGLGTDFARRLRTDPIRKTELQIVLLQTLFSLLIFALAVAALGVLYQSTLISIVAKMQEQIASGTAVGLPSIITAGTFVDIQTSNLVVIGVAGLLLMLVFGYVMLRVALTPAKNTLAAQKRFISNVAHELRTPLSIIKTNTEIRMLDTDIPEAARELHQNTLEELDRISHIINNLLTLNTLVNPGSFALSTVRLSPVVDTALEKLAQPIAKKNITIKTEIDTDATVRGNASALEQITFNIIKNAVIYTPRGGTITVSVANQKDDTVRFSVEDSGIGIAEKDLAHIFDPFYRADLARSRTKGGSGLGLVIVSELVQLHAGRITVHSELGHGTTVNVFIRRDKRAPIRPSSRR